MTSDFKRGLGILSDSENGNKWFYETKRLSAFRTVAWNGFKDVTYLSDIMQRRTGYGGKLIWKNKVG